MTVMRSTLAPMTGAAAGTCAGCGYVNATRSQVTRMSCGGCHESVVLDYVRGSFNGSMPCDDRCQYAIGSACSCTCGGDNHRVGYIEAPMVPVWVRQRDVERHAAKLARAAAKAAAERASRSTARDALIADNPLLGDLLGERYAGADGFAGDMRAALKTGQMTPRQIAAALGMVTRDRERAAARDARDARADAARSAGVCVPTGRVEITGVITYVTEEADPFKPYEAYRVIVTVATDQGWSVRGTLPRGLEPPSPHDTDDWAERERRREAEIGWAKRLPGRRVAFTASVEPGKRDPLFGFYKRPRPARFVDVAPDAAVPAPAPAVDAVPAVDADDWGVYAADDWAAYAAA